MGCPQSLEVGTEAPQWWAVVQFDTEVRANKSCFGALTASRERCSPRSGGRDTCGREGELSLGDEPPRGRLAVDWAAGCLSLDPLSGAEVQAPKINIATTGMPASPNFFTTPPF